MKAEPVLFVDPPDYEAVAADAALERQRIWLQTTSEPRGVVAHLLHEHRGRRRELRALFLRDGYLYADSPRLASALVDFLRADLLFDEPAIWIQRGGFVWQARRDSKTRRYQFLDGPRAGRAVTLLLFDRIGAGIPQSPLHRDLRALRNRLGFERFEATHLTPRRVVARLRYGQDWITTLLDSHGANLDLVCELVPEPVRTRVLDSRRLTLTRLASWRAVQRAIQMEVDDALPFDEPRHEVGQEDGKLREAWLNAYERGELTYRYHEDEYSVYDARGRPLVPQVCVDFVLDTLELAAGSWWRAQGEPPARILGNFAICPLERPGLRRVSELVAFARQHPDWFDVLEIEDQIPFGSAGEFNRFLWEHIDDFGVGDIVLIGGYVPWDRRRYVHYHSFFLFDADPVTGLSISLAGNAGVPSLRTWLTEMKRTPKRTLRFRIRMNPDWLEGLIQKATPAELSMPPFLASG